MKLVIIGRTGTGKTALANKFVEAGLVLLRTSTTRPPRYAKYFGQTKDREIVELKKRPDGGFDWPDGKTGDVREDMTVYEDDRYNFLTPDQAAAIPDCEKLLYTNENGYEYFATQEALEKSDVYIIDPKGLNDVVKLMPDVSFHVVHATATDTAKQVQMAVARADDPIQEELNFRTRSANEDKMFSDFEAMLADKAPNDPIAPNCVAIHAFDNDFRPETLDSMAGALLGYFHAFRNVTGIVAQSLDLGILSGSKYAHLDVVVYDEKEDGPAPQQAPAPAQPAAQAPAQAKPKTHVESVPIELYVDLLFSDRHSLNHLLQCWLCHPNRDLAASAANGPAKPEVEPEPEPAAKKKAKAKKAQEGPQEPREETPAQDGQDNLPAPKDQPGAPQTAREAAPAAMQRPNPFVQATLPIPEAPAAPGQAGQAN